MTLNLGLRYNTWKGSFPPQSSPGFSYGDNVNFPAITVDEEIEVVDWASFDPRLAAAIGLDSGARSVLRLALSRYSHGIAITYFQLGNPNGFSTATHPWIDFNGNFFADPEEVLPAIATSFATGGAIDPHLRQPYTDEFTVGFEQQIGNQLSLTVNAYYRESKDLVEDMNVSATEDSFVPVEIPDPGPDTIMGTEDDSILTVFNQIDDFSNVLLITNPDAAERKAKGAEVVLTKRLSDNWQALASLAWQRTTGTVSNNWLNALGTASAFNDPNSLINLNGALALDREWQAKLVGTYLAPLGFSFTGNLQYLTGVPIYREYAVSLNQGAVVVVADPKDTHREDSIARLDLRVDKTFMLGRSVGLVLSLDVFNVFNGNTAIRSSPNGGTYIPDLGVYLPPPVSFGAPQEIESPRILRFGARVWF